MLFSRVKNLKKLYKNLNSSLFDSITSKRTLWITFSALARIGMLIFINRLLTKQLDFQNLSIYYIVFSIYNFFGSIIIGPFGEYVNKIFFTINNDFNISFFLESYYKKLFVPVALISLVTLSFPLSVYFNVNMDKNYFIEIPILISLMLIFKGIFDSNISFINGLGNYKVYSILITLNALIYGILSYFFTSFMGATYFLWIGGFVLANIIFAILTIFYLRLSVRKNLPRRKFKFNSEVLSHIPYLIVTNLLLWFLTDGFRFFSEIKFGLKNSATILLGFALASQLFSVLSNFILPLFTPDFLKAFSHKKKYERNLSFKNYFLKITPFLILTLFLSIMFSKIIIDVLVDISKITEDLIYIFIIGLFVEFIRSLLVLFKNYFLAEKKLIYIVFPLSFSSILFVIISFIPIYSGIKFSLYILSTYLICLILTIIFANRLKKETI